MRSVTFCASCMQALEFDDKRKNRTCIGTYVYKAITGLVESKLRSWLLQLSPVTKSKMQEERPRKLAGRF